jgi:chromosome segregation ATPase
MEQQEQAGELVPVLKAAELLGVRRQTLDMKLRRRGLKPVRQVVRGRALVYLPKAWLEELRTDQATDQATDQVADQAGQKRPQEGRDGHQAADQGTDQVADQPRLMGEAERLRAEVAELRAKLDAVQAEAHALGGKLAGAEYVERATGRRCDKLEQRVEAMQADLVAQARELGKRDTLVAMLRDQVTDRDQRLEKLEDAPVDVGPWWLPRILKGG